MQCASILHYLSILWRKTVNKVRCSKKQNKPRTKERKGIHEDSKDSWASEKHTMNYSLELFQNLIHQLANTSTETHWVTARTLRVRTTGSETVSLIRTRHVSPPTWTLFLLCKGIIIYTTKEKGTWSCAHLTEEPSQDGCLAGKQDHTNEKCKHINMM